MHGLYPSICRRHFLASAAVGAIGTLLPLTPAYAGAPPPTSAGAETLASATSPTAALFELQSLAPPRPGGPTVTCRIEPWIPHASDAELADLKRRITEYQMA